MIRGIYTAASSMVSQQRSLDVTANNLSNANTVGFRRGQVVFKSFPEMLVRRVGADGVHTFPLGSYDRAPVVGKIGTGVTVDAIQTDFSDGLNIRSTEQDFDLALQGEGFFVVHTPQGERYTRAGNFTINKEGVLVTQDGHPVLGDNGSIVIQRNNFRVDPYGVVTTNPRFEGNPLVDRLENGFSEEHVRDRLRIVTFRDERNLQHDGGNRFRASSHAGNPVELEPGRGRAQVLQGYVETSNVNVVTEMVQMIATQRAYEASAKALQSHDQLLGRAFNEVMKI